jgi:carboxypeptidase PM20D1
MPNSINLNAAIIICQSEHKGEIDYRYEKFSTLSISDTLMLSQWLRIPSYSGKEAEAGRYLMDICTKTGLFIRQFGDQDGNFNFAASLYDLDELKPNFIFLNHLDISPLGGAKWMHPPFDGKIINDEIWGRGAFDNKGGAVIQLSAISHFVETSRNKDLPFNITFLSTSCEETQCTGGIRYVLEHYLDLLNPMLVVSEGPPGLDSLISSKPDMTVFGIATSQKKAVWLKLELNIRTNGHSSVPPLEYANQEMVQLLNRITSEKPPIEYTKENKLILKELGKLEGGIKGFVLRHPVLFKPLLKAQLRKRPEIAALFSNTITITGIANPAMIQNAIPEKVVCLLDCRLLPGTDTENFINTLRKKVKNKSVIIERVFESPDVETTGHELKAFKLLRSAITQQFGKETPVVPVLLPNFTDGQWFREKGIPVLEITPVRMKRNLMNCIHGIDERLPLEALSQGKDVFISFINSMISEIIRP